MASEDFYSHDPAVEDYWRGIVLFGRNVASYKFALAKSLLDLSPQSGQLLKMADIAPKFAQNVSEHMRVADKQCKATSSKYLNACRQFNSGEIDDIALVEQTVRYAFNNVIDAFHVVGERETSTRFFVDERKVHGGIRITEEFSALRETAQNGNLHDEVEARWRLVETAWELKVSRGLLCIEHDPASMSLFAVDKSRRQRAVTSSRSALNGYQKGKCFYCNCDIFVNGQTSNTDVDHFFPHVLKQFGFGSQVDGVWNLVLACRECNRGTKGKFARVPSVRLLAKLSKRNKFLIVSHHPLRETLLMQTGESKAARNVFLNKRHQMARTALLHIWEPEEKAQTPF